MSFKIIPLTRAVPALLGEAAAKTITLASSSTAMEGEIDGTNANAWIYAVDDGGDDVVVSWVDASEHGAICLARLDPSAGVDAITGKCTVTGEVVVYEGDENKMVKGHLPRVCAGIPLDFIQFHRGYRRVYRPLPARAGRGVHDRWGTPLRFR